MNMMTAEHTENRRRARSFMKLFFASFATKILVTVLRLVRNAILARVLGPGLRGVFALINALPELVAALGNLGYPTAAAYAAAQRRYPMSAILGGVLLFVIVIGGVLALLTMAILQLDFIMKDNRDAMVGFAPLIALAVPLYMFRLCNGNLLTARSSIIEGNLLRILESASPLLLFVLLWWGLDFEPLDAAVWSWIAGAVLVVIAGSWWLRQHGAYPPRLSRPLLKESLHYGVRSHFDTLFEVALLRVDFVFVGSMLGAEALGFYAMGTAAAELLVAIPDSVNMPLMAILMGSKTHERESATPLALKMVLVTMTVAAIGMAVVGESLIGLLFGSEFLPAYGPLLWLLPGIVAYSLSGIMRLYLLGHGCPGIVSITAGWCLGLNVVLNMLLIPGFGIEGAAIASSVAYIANAGLLYRQYFRLSRRTPRQTFLLSASEVRWIFSELRTWMRERAA